jgi:hypothetical protein
MNNYTFSPMEGLHAVLKAHFNDHPARHWVVFKGEIVGMKLMAIAYAWSQRGVSYMISKCGSMQMHEIKYLSTLEDKYGDIDHKEINCPQVCHFINDHLPLMDKCNKQR